MKYIVMLLALLATVPFFYYLWAIVSGQSKKNKHKQEELLKESQ